VTGSRLRGPELEVGRSGALSGVAVAGLTALVSGVAVFVNAYGVRALPNPSVYTAAKNLTTALVLGALSALSLARPAPALAKRWTEVHGRAGRPDRGGAGTWAALAFVGIVGGGVAFVLFFDGLARLAATPAAFLHDSLVVWVGLLAFVVLKERPTGWNVAAVGLLVGGEVAVVGGIGHLGASSGTLMVLGATMLWAIETVLAKRLLLSLSPAAVALTRMGVGSVVLVGYVAVTAGLGSVVRLSAGQWGWVLLSGLLLAGYVATWMTALARARALDVTSVLVASVVVTGLLQWAAGARALAPEALGLALVAVGAVLVAWAARRRRVALGDLW
jgi:drug/metabolite transporter (DMT)-like permease